MRLAQHLARPPATHPPPTQTHTTQHTRRWHPHIYQKLIYSPHPSAGATTTPPSPRTNLLALWYSSFLSLAILHSLQSLSLLFLHLILLSLSHLAGPISLLYSTFLSFFSHRTTHPPVDDSLLPLTQPRLDLSQRRKSGHYHSRALLGNRVVVTRATNTTKEPFL